MALPILTDEQRASALAKAVEVRARRSEVKRLLKQGTATLSGVLKDAAEDEALAKMKVASLLEAMPGVGKTRRIQIMERLQISPDRRVRGLGANQRVALEAEFAGA
jgi:hypothetical protein